MKQPVVLLVIGLMTYWKVCHAQVCQDKTTKYDIFKESCSDLWSGEGATCYQLVISNETYHSYPRTCTGFAVDMEEALEPAPLLSIEQDTLTSRTIFLGVFKNETETNEDDETTWVWIEGEDYNDNSSWHVNYTVKPFEKNCSSNIVIAKTVYNCSSLPCQNCSSIFCIDPCKNYTFGNVSDRGVYPLEETKYNKKVVLNCDYGPPGERIEAHCIYPWNQTADTQWKLRNVESCWNRSVAILEFAKVKFNESTVVSGTQTVARMTRETESLKTNEIGSLSTILTNIANVTQNQTQDKKNVTQPLDQAAEEFYQIINAMLYINETKLLTSQGQSNSSSRMLVAAKELSEKRSFSIKNGSDTSLPNIAVSLAKVDSKTNLTVYAESDVFRLAKPPNVSVSMTLPKKIFENKDGETSKVVYILYRSTGFFLVDGKDKAEIRSYVIAASVLGKEIKELETPIVIRYPKNVSAGLCVFWDFAANQRRGDWSTAGCKFFKSDEYDECHCNHLTNFAMLLDVKPDETSEQKSLSIISYIGCSVSLLGIVLTITTMFYFKELLASKCSKIFLNICIALAAALAVFLGAAERSKTFSNTHCIAAGMMNHFFFLAALFWMVFEAYTMYLAFVKVLPKQSLEGKIPPLWGCCLICWGIPAVIVGITAGLSYNSYSNGEYCFLQGMPMVIAFFIPVVLCIFINTVAFTGILRSILKSGTTVTSTLKTSGFEQARRGMAISVFLGLTWISGVFAIGEAKLIFQYIFCIINSLQGWLIFLFYIVLSTEVRNKFRTRFFRASSRADHIRSHTNAAMMKEIREGRFSTTDGTSVMDSIDMIDIRDAAIGGRQKRPTK